MPMEAVTKVQRRSSSWLEASEITAELQKHARTIAASIHIVEYRDYLGLKVAV